MKNLATPHFLFLFFCLNLFTACDRVIMMQNEIYDVYIGNYPGVASTEWAHDAQGLTHDDTHWYITQTRTLWKIPVTLDLNTVNRNTAGITLVDLQTIPGLWNLGYDHFGDISYYNFQGQAYILIPLEDDKRGSPSGAPSAIAAFDANTLSYIDHASIGLKDAPWCAVDPLGFIYSSNTGNKVLKFTVDWPRLNSHKDLVFNNTMELTLLNETGTASLTIDTPQGGAISPSGQLLYLSAGYSTGSHSSWGLHIFDLLNLKRLARSKNGTGPFNYEFHPGGTIREEPEGMTIWDLENRTPNEIGGQLHVFMLDNDWPDEGDIYFKHYTTKKAYPVLYEHTNYGGKPVPLRSDIAQLGDHDFNDEASSIYLPSGWTVSIFQHVNYGGESWNINISQADFHVNNWGDKASSIKVIPPITVGP